MRSAFIVFVAVTFLTASGCSSTPKRPFVQMEPRILLVLDQLSPKWEELVRENIPEEINDRANGNLVSYGNVKDPKFKLVVRFVGAGKEITGTSTVGGATVLSNTAIGSANSKVKSIYTLEVEARLIAGNGQLVWRWTGYAEDKNAKDAVEKIGEKIGNELSKSGYLDLSTYLPLNK